MSNKYRVWDCHKDLRDLVINSVKASDEERVNRFIENLRKVTDPELKGLCEECAFSLSLINKYLRHDIACCEAIMGVDMLENICIFQPWKGDSFQDCISKIEKYTGIKY